MAIFLSPNVQLQRILNQRSVTELSDLLAFTRYLRKFQLVIYVCLCFLSFPQMFLELEFLNVLRVPEYPTQNVFLELLLLLLHSTVFVAVVLFASKQVIFESCYSKSYSLTSLEAGKRSYFQASLSCVWWCVISNCPAPVFF